jgi:hypothetical protein
VKQTLALVIVIFANLSHAQESEKYIKLKQNYSYNEGYILDKDSMKIEGLIKEGALSEAKKYAVVNFVHKDGTRKKYYPADIKGFGHSGDTFVSDNDSFYEIIQTGKKVTLYLNVSANYWTAPGAPGMAPITHSSIDESFFVKRPNEKAFTLVRKRKFKEDFSKYFADCPAVASNILTGEFTHKDIEEIVSMYNSCK